MWTRLGLSDHILRTRLGASESEYLVTFKTFDPAAAFVNQVHGHWLDDEMTGQVYVTWDPIETFPNNVRAILTLPRATIEPWRKAASERGVATSKYGFPLVDWEQSLMSVFMRMNITCGRNGDCWLWRLVGEYDHIVILEIAFSTTDKMKWFVERKSEHYLSNSWKDRFFVKQKDRYSSILSCNSNCQIISRMDARTHAQSSGSLIERYVTHFAKESLERKALELNTCKSRRKNIDMIPG
jgi:hypothetical protein